MKTPKLKKRLPKFGDGTTNYPWVNEGWETHPLNAKFKNAAQQVKQITRPIMVDDFYYRYNKAHPENTTTLEQIGQQFDNQKTNAVYDFLFLQYPTVAGSDIGGLYMNAINDQNLVNRKNKTLQQEYQLPPIYNKESLIMMPINFETGKVNRHDFSHEMTHSYDDKLNIPLSDNEINQLKEAYAPFITENGMDPKELRAIHSSYRDAISSANNNAVKEDLDNVLDTISEQQMYDILTKGSVGYARANSEYENTANVPYKSNKYNEWISDENNLNEMRALDEYNMYKESYNDKNSPNYKAAKKYFKTRGGDQNTFSKMANEYYPMYKGKTTIQKLVIKPGSMNKLRNVLKNIAMNPISKPNMNFMV